MEAKKYILVLLLIATFVATVSCSSSGENTDNTVSETKNKKVELKMDVMTYERYLLPAIKKFNETHKDISINYGDVISYSEEYRNKYITRLSVGEGPDIIRIDPRIGLLTAIHKTADSGIFYDLNELIKNDKSFKLSDYNQKVLDSGVISGKRVLVPLCYNFSTFFAKEGVLKANGFTTEGDKYTLENFANEVYTFMQKNKDSGKYFMTLKNFALSDIVKISGLNFIDFEKRNSNFDSKEFVNLLNIYKKLDSVKTELPENIMMYGSDDVFGSSIGCPDFDTDKALIINNMYSEIWSRDKYNKLANANLFPQYTSKQSIIMEPYVSFAINSKCEHKKEAFEFIKLLLSEEFQTVNSFNGFIGLPVNNNAYSNSVNFYISNLINAQAVTGEYDAEKRKAQVKEQYKEIEKISVCSNVDAQIYDIINEEAKNFTDGKYSAKKTAESIQNKVMLYLNE